MNESSKTFVLNIGSNFNLTNWFPLQQYQYRKHESIRIVKNPESTILDARYLNSVLVLVRISNAYWY